MKGDYANTGGARSWLVLTHKDVLRRVFIEENNAFVPDKSPK